jgi:hypothetical protein
MDRVATFSADLLGFEEQCFAEIVGLFEQGVGDAQSALDASLRRVRDVGLVPADRTFIVRMMSLHVHVLDATQPYVVALAAKSVELALESIADELEHCEATQSQRLSGIAVEGVDFARRESSGLTTDAMMRFSVAIEAGQNAFTSELMRQTRLAASRGEDQTVLARRLLSPVPANLVGCGGRGVWWRASSGLQAAAREMAIGLSNAVRGAAMRGFNDAAAIR